MLNVERNNFSRRQKYLLAEKQGWKCKECGCKLRMYGCPEHYGRLMHIDHIFPVSKWEQGIEGRDELDNLQVLCFKCNLKKRDTVTEKGAEIYHRKKRDVPDFEVLESLKKAVILTKNYFECSKEKLEKFV